MTKHAVSKLVSLFFISLCAACGGGGGGSSPSTTITYRSSGTGENLPVQLSNGGLTSIGSRTPTSLTVDFQTSDNSRDINKLNYISYAQANGSQTFSSAQGDTVGTVTTPSVYDIVFAANSSSHSTLAFVGDYSAFGVWTAGSTRSGSLSANAGDVGSTMTSRASTVIPSATYAGGAVGYYGVVGFAPVLTAASFTATANFNAGSVAVQTANTTGFSLTTGANLGSYSALDFSGTLTETGTTNFYVGTVSDNAGMSGTADLSVYGPSANEVAGDVVLTKTNAAHVVAFGGSR